MKFHVYNYTITVMYMYMYLTYMYMTCTCRTRETGCVRADSVAVASCGSKSCMGQRIGQEKEVAGSVLQVVACCGACSMCGRPCIEIWSLVPGWSLVPVVLSSRFDCT